MPVDYKRINGPEDAVPYQLYAKLNTKSLQQQFDECFSNNVRKDGRKLNEHRKCFMKTGVVSQAKGSAYLELGDTKVIVSVFDPREIPNRSDYTQKGEIYCEFKFAPFSCPKRRMYQADAEEKQYSSILKQALEAAVCRHEFPNFQVDVYALVLHNAGSALSASITAATLALSHGGVPMYDLVTSVTVAVQNGLIILDPNLEEEELCKISLKTNEECNHGVVVLSFMATHEQVSQFYQTGNMELEDLKKCLDLGLIGCREVLPLVQKSLVKHVIKSNSKNEDSIDT